MPRANAARATALAATPAIAVLDFGIRYEEAVLGWFEALPEELGGGSG